MYLQYITKRVYTHNKQQRSSLGLRRHHVATSYGGGLIVVVFPLSIYVARTGGVVKTHLFRNVVILSLYMYYIYVCVCTLIHAACTK